MKSYVFTLMVLVEEVGQLKCEIMEHFRKHFQCSQQNRPLLENFEFKQLDVTTNNELVETFKEEEIWLAVWDCEAQKVQIHMVLTLFLLRNSGRLSRQILSLS